jgi:hypothetical protein
LIADAHGADVGLQSGGTIKLNFIGGCLAVRKRQFLKRNLVVLVKWIPTPVSDSEESLTC